MYTVLVRDQALGLAWGTQGLILFFTLRSTVSPIPLLSNLVTHVEYGLYADRVAVKFGLWAGSSHCLTPVLAIGSDGPSTLYGGLSVMYDIHACLVYASAADD